MQRKLLGGRHVILWKPELSEKLLYVIAQFFIALYLSSSTTKTPTHKKNLEKPINQIQKKNHRRNRHTHKK